MNHLVVTWSIAALCVLIGAYMWLFPLAKAWNLLREARERVADEKDGLEGVDAGAKTGGESQANTYTHKVIAKLHRQARSGIDPVNVESALEDAARQMLAAATWPRFYAHIAVYVGLLGTIGGLWFALSDLQGSTQIHDEATLRTFAASTQALLGSLQGAFVSALAGVLVTAALGALVQRYDRACESYLQEIDEFARENLMPRLEEVRLGLLPHSGIEAAKLIVTQLDKTLSTFTKAWAERFKTLADHSTLISETSQRLAESAKNIESTTDSLAESTVALDSRLSSLAFETAELSKVSHQSEQVVAAAAQAVTELSRRAVQWPDIAGQLGETSAGVAGASTSVREAAEGLKGATFDLVRIVENLRTNVQELSQESYKQLTDAVLNAISDVVHHAGEEIKGLSAAAQEREERILAMVGQVEAASQRQASLAGEMASAVHQMYALLPPLSDPGPTLEELLRRLNALKDAISSLCDSFVKRALAVKDVQGDGAPSDGQFKLLLDEMALLKDQVSAISASISQYRAVGESASRHLELIARAVSTQSGAEDARTPQSRPPQRRKIWPFGRS